MNDNEITMLMKEDPQKGFEAVIRKYSAYVMKIAHSSTVWIYSNLSRFTDPNKVNEIMINGNTLWRR